MAPQLPLRRDGIFGPQREAVGRGKWELRQDHGRAKERSADEPRSQPGWETGEESV